MTALPKPEAPISETILADTVLARRFTAAALAAPDWPKRAAVLDDLIADAVGDLIAVNCDATEATGALYLSVTCMLETLGESTIESTDAALFYLLSTHAPWREAARAFLCDHDRAALLRTRPGVRLLWRIAAARVAVLDAADMQSTVRH